MTFNHHRIGQHRPHVGGNGQNGERLEQNEVEHGVDGAARHLGKEDHAHDDKLGVEDEAPGEEDADHAAAVAYEPKLGVAASVVVVPHTLDHGGLHQ